MTAMASDVRIGILGPLEVRVGFGEPVEIASTVPVRASRSVPARAAIPPKRFTRPSARIA
jgi:hypothetical protein